MFLRSYRNLKRYALTFSLENRTKYPRESPGFQTTPKPCLCCEQQPSFPFEISTIHSISENNLLVQWYKEIQMGFRKRWWRNRMGRPLSPSQIPQKNISTPSKLHKTTSVGRQRTSGNQKSRLLSSKTGRKKYKR